MTDHELHPLPGVPRSAFLPGGLLALAFVAFYLLSGGDMVGWGLSSLALDKGRWWTLLSHLFAHGDLMHLAFNALIVFFISGPIVARLGPPPGSWLRFALLFLASGFGGAALFLAINPGGVVPAIGASGAAFGLLGLLSRLPRPTGPVAAERYQRLRPLSADMIGRNLFLLAVLVLPGLLVPGFMGIAWEAHLGGFLTGFLAGPLFVPGRR